MSLSPLAFSHYCPLSVATLNLKKKMKLYTALKAVILLTRNEVIVAYRPPPPFPPNTTHQDPRRSHGPGKITAGREEWLSGVQERSSPPKKKTKTGSLAFEPLTKTCYQDSPAVTPKSLASHRCLAHKWVLLSECRLQFHTESWQGSSWVSAFTGGLH